MLKQFSRSQNLKLILTLLVLSLFHLYVIVSLNVGESAFDLSRFIGFLIEKWPVFALFIITFFSVFYVKKISRPLLIIFLAVIFSYNIYLFFLDLNKSLMFLSFIFFVVSLYFVGVWNFELEEAVYSPNYNLNDLEIRPFIKFDSWVETSSGDVIGGILTNWDKNGCFFVPSNGLTVPPQNLTLKINFEETKYSQKGQVVSAYGRGIGIRFNFHKESGNFLNWNDFFKLIDDRSYRPNG